MRRPKLLSVIGFLVVVLGIVPVFPTAVRVGVVLLGAVIALVAVSRALAGRTGDEDLSARRASRPQFPGPDELGPGGFAGGGGV